MRQTNKTAFNKIFVIALILSGIAFIFFSAIVSSSFLAILGGSQLFWGGLLQYLTPSRYMPLAYLTQVLEANSNNEERLLSGLKQPVKGFYLPPKSLKNPKLSLVCVTSTSNEFLKNGLNPKTLFSNDGSCLYLTPPGCGLSMILEEAFGRPFIQIKATSVQKVLSKLFVDDNSIVRNIRITIEKNIIRVELEDNLFQEDCKATKNFPLTQNAIGCLMSSTIACILAKMSGKAIVLEKEEQNSNVMLIEYQTIDV